MISINVIVSCEEEVSTVRVSLRTKLQHSTVDEVAEMMTRANYRIILFEEKNIEEEQDKYENIHPYIK
jgi:hypothetical protein